MKFDRLRIYKEWEYDGQDWLIAECGNDCYDGHNYVVTTDRVSASECSSASAKDYAQLFSAAPELYAVAKITEDVMNTVICGKCEKKGTNFCKVDCYINQKFLSIIKKAISKAEGNEE